MRYHLQGIVKEYSGRTVLQLDELCIMEGEVLALVGPSGAGKSTLLRLLNFLEQPSCGTIVFDGHAIADRPPLCITRAITTVFQRPLLLDRSVRHNVAYGLRLRGRRDDGAVEAALAAAGLSALAAARARTLSGGEMQRVALARALVIEPRVLLLDEPTANLDPANVAIIEAAVRELHARQGTTIVLATHNLYQARRLASRVALLLDGRLIEIGSTGEILNAPRDPRTRAFVSGEMVY
jgi:tungstate transport system ATP-binding protein